MDPRGRLLQKDLSRSGETSGETHQIRALLDDTYEHLTPFCTESGERLRDPTDGCGTKYPLL
jgi:hypothetical protein